MCFTTSLIAAVCAVGLGGSALAFAETEDEATASPYYPTTFETVPEFDELDDYAVGGGKILFLENNKISEYGGERVVTYQGNFKPITNLYFEGDAFYYKTLDKFYYALDNLNEDENPEIENFKCNTKTNYIDFGDYLYYYNTSSGVLQVLNTATGASESLDDCTNIKEYGEKVYAVRTTDDNKKVLCTLNGTEKSDVTVKNFEITENIAVGSAYEKLTSSAGDLQFVSLTIGAYMTEVDLNALKDDPATFKTGDTVKVNKAETAILLYTNKDAADATKGISIVALKGKTYLIHPDNTKVNVVFIQELNKEGTATEGHIYSAPIETAGTRIKNSEGKDVVVSGSITIIKEITKNDRPELDGDFYLITYEEKDEDGNVTATYTGYVRFGLISTHIFNEDPPTETPDPEATYEDLIKPVVLILLVLLLIAIAAGYLIYVGTSDKRKKKAEAATTDTTERDKR